MVETDRLTALSASIRARARGVAGRAVVGLSGGADSAAVLWHLVDAGLPTRAVHVLHGLPASPMMATAAGQVAARLGVELTMRTVQPDGTSEDALRRARHAALLEGLDDDEVVVLGHTADDQAETVLLRLIRGTGPAGLGAMSDVRGRFVRPFLGIRRHETRELARLAGLPFRDDPANDDISALRNRVRAELLPLIDEMAGGHAVTRLTRLAELSRTISRGALPVGVEWRTGEARIPLGVLAVHEAPARVVRRIVRRLDPPYPPDRSATDRVLEVVRGEVRSTEIRSGLGARVEGAFLVIGPGRVEPMAWGPVLLVDGVATGGISFRVREGSTTGRLSLSPRRAFLPAGSALAVRPPRPGDRVAGRRVDAALVDAGVAPERRPWWPVVTVDGEPTWIPGVRPRVWSGGPSDGYLDVTASEDPPWLTSEP